MKRGIGMIMCVAACVMAAGMALSGCELMYFANGKGQTGALFTIPKNARVLVCVDARPGVAATVETEAALAERIAAHLYRHKAVDQLVAQQRLSDLRRNPKYSTMGISDIAKQTEADVVLFVDLVQFDVSTLPDESMTDGKALAMVKVVDKDGNRMWPAGDGPGEQVEAHSQPALMEKANREAVTEEISDLIVVRTARMFHAYNVEDKSITK